MNKVSEVTVRKRTNKSKNQRQTNRKPGQTVVTTTRSVQVPKQKKKKSSRQGPRQQMFSMRSCTRRYLEALSYPFGSNDQVCIPDILDIPSSKVRTMMRGVVTLGTGSFGFIQISPGLLLANNLSGISISTDPVLFTGTSTNAGGPGTAQISNTQSPFQGAAFGPGPGNIQGRVVACGVRIRYIGTELNRGGRVTYYRPSHGETTNGISTATALANRTSISSQVNRSWKGLSYMPQAQLDYEYTTNPSANPDNGTFRFAFLIDGTAGNQFEFQVVHYAEYVGTTFNISGSDSDIVGMSNIRQVLNSTDTVIPAEASYLSTLFSMVGGYAAAAASTTVNVAASRASTRIVDSLL